MDDVDHVFEMPEDKWLQRVASALDTSSDPFATRSQPRIAPPLDDELPVPERIGASTAHSGAKDHSAGPHLSGTAAAL